MNTILLQGILGFIMSMTALYVVVMTAYNKGKYDMLKRIDRRRRLEEQNENLVAQMKEMF